MASQKKASVGRRNFLKGTVSGAAAPSEQLHTPHPRKASNPPARPLPRSRPKREIPHQASKCSLRTTPAPISWWTFSKPWDSITSSPTQGLASAACMNRSSATAEIEPGVHHLLPRGIFRCDGARVL